MLDRDGSALSTPIILGTLNSQEKKITWCRNKGNLVQKNTESYFLKIACEPQNAQLYNRFMLQKLRNMGLEYDFG